ncbi:hypothetical protein [Polaribacter marinivivus]|jgi:uncharacterized membrane protein YeaQ/YmgE (transglycosylase-associated protein family)|uniref:hypothetical protein n=1 Tax=Polaribacter marinivivus TaxID=1524260 RepID=UPI003D337AF5
MKIITSIIVGFLIGALSYWFNPYNEMYVAGINIYKILGFGSFISSILLTYFLKEKFYRTALFMTLGVFFAVFSRIVYDIKIDGSSHNLFPFEIIFTSIITIVAAIVGGYLTESITKSNQH